jgi:hypothetical protein
MRFLRVAAVPLLLISPIVLTAKDKKKSLLPDDVLQAKTVLVVVQPGAGIEIDAPNANRTALDDVENALTNGAFPSRSERVRCRSSHIGAQRNGKMAQPTIGGVPVDNRPVVVESTPDASIHPTPGATQRRRPDPHPQLETGPSEDMFAVYRGKRENATDYPAIWRFSGKDALRSPGVPTVDAFRKLIVEAEKQRAANP